VKWPHWRTMSTRKWRNYALMIEANTWPINRPRASVDWYDQDECGLSISWSNGNSDPVICVTISASRGSLIHRFAERRWQRKADQEANAT
jgi:hypothetical protein